MQQVYEEQQNTKMTGKSGEEVLPLKCLFYMYNSICLKSIDIGFEIVCVYVCFCCCCCCCCFLYFKHAHTKLDIISQSVS